VTHVCPVCFQLRPSVEQEQAIRRNERRFIAALVAAELGDDFGLRVARLFRDEKARREFSRLAAAFKQVIDGLGEAEDAA